MGLEFTVRFPAGSTPAWEAVKVQLARLGESPPLRMIDGLPAFPDETPAEDWRELRVGFAAGMVTLRRGTDSLICVVWSSAGPALLAARDQLAWACAAAGQGIVGTPDGEFPTNEFAERSGLSPA